MKQYICSYNNENTPDFESEVFECWADNEGHAREQCENAYPTAFIAEVYLADETWGGHQDWHETVETTHRKWDKTGSYCLDCSELLDSIGK